MTTALAKISAAIKLIDAKKERLKKAYDELQSHSSLLSSDFSLSWSDLDAHFTTVQTSLSDRLRILESLEPVQNRTEADGGESEVVRLELRSLCEKMNGIGLRKYITDHTQEREVIRLELCAAMQGASDPAAMVLDAIEGFCEEKSSNGDAESAAVRRVFVLLLEQLMEINPNLGLEVKERAKRIAFDWKKACSDGNKPLEALGFLHLVAAYGLGSEFDMNELIDYFVIISRYKQATSLCKKIGLGDKVTDLIQKLLDSGKLVLAIRFAFEFQMTGRFQPVPILKSYLNDSKKAAQKVCKEGNNTLRAQNEATDKEVSALKAVIKIIEEYNIKSEISKESLEKRVEEMQKKKAERKRPANTAKPAKEQPNKHQQRGNKRPRMAGPIGPSFVKPLPQPAGFCSFFCSLGLNSPPVLCCNHAGNS